MSDNDQRLGYDPRTGPDREAWLKAPEAERTLAVRRWLRHNDMPFPCCVPRSADVWREVEDRIASGTPPSTTRLMQRMRDAGLERIVALWAVAEILGSQRFRQLERQHGTDGNESLDVQDMFDEHDAAILPAAFEASAGGFGPAHQQVIDYYRQHYDPEGAMGFAVAAGFSFGCAASPQFVRNQTLYEHMFGNEIVDATPAYLPVADAYRELFRFVSDAVFEQDDPVPEPVRPPSDAESCFDSPFSDWCKGFVASEPVVATGWEAHLSGHPDLHAEYRRIVDTLRFFADREQARDIVDTGSGDESLPGAARRVHAALGDAIRRLFRLAQPITEID
jgi:hypothetical protein